MSTQSAAPYRVLVVEDDPSLRDLLCDLLRDEGYRVESAENGTAGFAAAHAHPPDLILLDMLMPGMSGLQLYALLQADTVTAGIPVVFETAVTSNATKVESLRSGETVKDYITKPFNVDELLARVAIALRHGHEHGHEGEETSQ